MIEDGPTSAIHGVVRWRIVDLCQRVFQEFRIAAAKQTMSRELREMGLRKLRRGRAIMRGRKEQSRILKKFPDPPGENRVRKKSLTRPSDRTHW